MDDVAIYLAALVRTEKGTQNGDYATGLAKQFLRLQASANLQVRRHTTARSVLYNQGR